MSNSAPYLAKAVLSSPNNQDEEKDPTKLMYSNRLFEFIRKDTNISVQEVHKNRIKSLRKELDYINETKWKYEPIEKYMGQG